MNQELEKKVFTYPEKAKSIQVINQESLTEANQFLLAIKSLRNEVDNAWNPVIESAHKAHKQAIEQKRKFENPLIEAEKLTKSSISKYLQEQERIRRDAEEARRRIEEEKRRLEEEALKKAMGAKTEKEVEKIIEEAAVKENQIEIPKIQEAPKTEGISMRDNWQFEIFDETLIPREYMIPDQVKIGKVVRALKDKANVPGVRVFNQPIMSARREYK
jgi:hypothetical protein